MNPPNDPQAELVLKLKEANNILVTVSANPSVDQLAAAIGLTILLNKLKKHATAVFSGEVPSTIDFLQPDDTLEKNTDSLRDFIIALDKAKADKLRYKVEENIVKIFITPYKTSITQDDLDFSQGDFNVDVVLALGVHEQQELDQAITAHGRILHDATVISVNISTGAELGVINWTVPDASSLSELAVEIADALGKDLIDGQIATSLLTGIVAETERFSNEKTSPETMRLSAELMAAGANQQLVASELQQPAVDRPTDNQRQQPDTPPKPDDGTLEITHPGEQDALNPTTPEPVPDAPEPQPANDEQSSEVDTTPTSAMPLLPPSQQDGPQRILEPPSMSGQLTANSVPEDAEDSFGGLPMHEPDLPILNRDEPASPPPATPPVVPPAAGNDAVDQLFASKPADTPELELPQPVSSPSESYIETPVAPLPMAAPVPDPQTTVPDPSMPQPPSFTPATDTPTEPWTPPVASGTPPPSDGTLADIEQSVHSPHVQTTATPTATVDTARNAVMDAINSIPAGDQPLPPKEDVGASGYLNVQDLPDDPNLLPSSATDPVPYVPEPTPGNTPADTPLTMPLPPSTSLSEPASGMPPTSPSGVPAPPPVPPPMTELPPFVNPNNPQ